MKFLINQLLLSHCTISLFILTIFCCASQYKLMASLVCSVVYSLSTLMGTWKHSARTSQSGHMKPPVKNKTGTSGPCPTRQSYRQPEPNLPAQLEGTAIRHPGPNCGSVTTQQNGKLTLNPTRLSVEKDSKCIFCHFIVKSVILTRSLFLVLRR